MRLGKRAAARDGAEIRQAEHVSVVGLGRLVDLPSELRSLHAAERARFLGV